MLGTASTNADTNVLLLVSASSPALVEPKPNFREIAASMLASKF